MKQVFCFGALQPLPSGHVHLTVNSMRLFDLGRGGDEYNSACVNKSRRLGTVVNSPAPFYRGVGFSMKPKREKNMFTYDGLPARLQIIIDHADEIDFYITHLDIYKTAKYNLQNFDNTTARLDALATAFYWVERGEPIQAMIWFEVLCEIQNQAQI